MLNFKNRSFLEAPIVKNNSFNSLLVERSPSNVLTVMGKKVINTVTTTLLQMEYPNQRTKIGARAMVGTICEAIITGYKACSTNLLRYIQIASPIPSKSEIAKPIAMIRKVDGRCSKSKTDFNAQSFSVIAVGEGRMNGKSTIRAPISHPINNSRTSKADVPYRFIFPPSIAVDLADIPLTLVFLVYLNHF